MRSICLQPAQPWKPNGSYDAQLAVASCIINRVKSKHWGKSISSVIYADGQFPGASSGLLDSFLAQGPSKTALKASKDALCGSNNIGDYLYFNSTKRISPEDYSSYKIVGGNCFYKKIAAAPMAPPLFFHLFLKGYVLFLLLPFPEFRLDF